MDIITFANYHSEHSSESITKQDGINLIQFNGDKLRSRKVVLRSNTKATGKWPSWKTGRMMQYESGNEKNAFKLLDASPAVRSYSEQPCIIHYILDGKVQRHFPDILVDFGTYQEIWEVKTYADSRDPEILRRTELLTKYLTDFGYVYRMVIAEDLKTAPRLSNVELLMQYGRQPVSLIKLEQIRQLFKKTKDLRWGYFQLGEPGAIYLKSICRLIFEGVLIIDINLPLEIQTIIKVGRSEGGESWL